MGGASKNGAWFKGNGAFTVYYFYWLARADAVFFSTSFFGGVDCEYHCYSVGGHGDCATVFFSDDSKYFLCVFGA